MAKRNLKKVKDKKDRKKILFIHQAFPAQFSALAKDLVDDGHEVVGLCLFPPQSSISGIRTVVYPIVRVPLVEPPYLLSDIDAKILRAESAANAMRELKENGFYPDVVYAHPGWGEGLFAREIFPKARFGVYAEWFYNLEGQEVNFDPELPKLTFEEEMKVKLKNMAFLYALNDADFAISPTEWQKSRFPLWAQNKIEVIHDGLPLKIIKTVQARKISIPEKNIEVKYGDPIVTFASRYLEPVRGFHIFMRAIPKILKANSRVRIFIMGNEVKAGYGPKRSDDLSWKQALIEEIKDQCDLERVHFIGFIPYLAYLSVLKMSSCHVYLTHPFILGWSFFEAAAAGIPIVASATPPVLEFKDKVEGLRLIDFFEIDGLVNNVLEFIEKPNVRYNNKLQDLDLSVTLPKIKKILLSE